jgi:murein tripeptide amidase MpaA
MCAGAATALWLLVVLFAQAFPPVVAAAPLTAPRHDLILVEAPGDALAELAAAGYDVVGGKPGVEAVLVATAEDQQRLLAAGYRFEIQQADLENFYAARNGRAVGFGAFHTYSETTDQLDALHTAYPAVTTEKYSIGTTGEGRTIWAMKVSDNPDVDEDEPEVVFDALHHAREPMSTETCLLLIEYLGSHYATDARVRRLVDEREIFFVPVVNPDGYVYNETTNPSGGGMWRKNRRDNGDGSYGVDPNRNYPYEWVGPGSSSTPSSDIYRGPSAGSEPETQALMNLSLAHQFQTAQSFHTYSNYVLFPWGYTTTHTPDDTALREIASIMASANGYAIGQAPEILYVVNGGSIDWMYGEQTLKGKVFAFSNEIGGSSDGFWPLDSRIPQLFQDNLEPALYLIEAAGTSMFLCNFAVTGGNSNGRLDAGESAGLAFDAQNGAVMTGADAITVTLLSDDAYLQLGEAQRTLGTLGPRAIWSGTASPFPVAVDAACPSDHVIPLTIRFSWTGGTKDISVNLPVGEPTLLVDDNMESGTSRWTPTSPWGLTTTQSHTATHSLTDSPAGNYGNNVNVSARLSASLDFTHIASPTLSFWTRYATEADYDFCYVEASTDGTNWQTLAGYNGSQTTWVQKTIPLDAYVGQSQVWLRWRFQSDSGVTADGWYIDDVAVSAFPTPADVAPTAPVAVAPIGGASVGDPLVLTVQNAVDADGPGALTYGFRIYADPLFTQPVATQAGVAEGIGETAWTVPLGSFGAGPYYWRAWADDTALRGLLGGAAAFVYDAAGGIADGFRRVYLSAAPVGGGTAFRFALRRAGRATLTLYNVRGERVATVFAGDVTGKTTAVWNHRDTGGARVASGLYLARLSGPGTELSLKVFVVR